MEDSTEVELTKEETAELLRKQYASVVQTKPRSKGKRFKDLLCTMNVGSSSKFDHQEFYCSGQGQRCTLTHYTSLLKQKGLGEWKVEHIEPGLAIVLRVN